MARHAEPHLERFHLAHMRHRGELSVTVLALHTGGDVTLVGEIDVIADANAIHAIPGHRLLVVPVLGELDDLTKYWNDKQPVPWNRVNRIRIRNNVYFTHKRHIAAGVQCE